MAENITIVGAGLVGSLLGTMLAQRGHKVTIFERRPDMRTSSGYAGRSINLAMSDRGLRALRAAGIANEILAIAIPMHGRMMHDLDGNQTFQPYGKEGQYINSVSRGELNKVLMNAAERHGVRIVFNARCTDVDVETASATFTLGTGETVSQSADILFGADGGFSAVRGRLQTRDRFTYSQTYIDHGYKELHIPADEAGDFRIEKNVLHIWPRHSFMMIGLPNPDGSFTLTLFYAHEGTDSFARLKTQDDVMAFFQTQFPDAIQHMPTLMEDFFTNPESSLMTIRCFPWVINNKVALIGDAAHGIVPFYGQGMICGFEDCRILMECLEHHNNNWSEALHSYQRLRKPAGDAIAELALDNFIEMRDKVADPHFLLRKKIEGWIHERYPTKFIPLYTMVVFSSDIPYNEALRIGREQDKLMAEIMAIPEVALDWTSEESAKAIMRVMDARPDVQITSGSPS